MAKANDGIVSKKVGWEGNFNDMALKTVIRRLLSKYGFLSVEMQNAISKDVDIDNSEADRNDMISGEANKKVIDIDSEVVDTETGEIQNAAPAEEDMPNY